MKLYLVGGAVRDELLGIPVKERDWVVVGGTEQEMLDANFTPVGKFFPVFLHPQTKEEYALARLERKVAGGYHGFTFDTSQAVTLEEDLQRRDLTINAMAKSEKGEIIDPYGGQRDLQQKLLRHVSPAFVEDPVRVLRVARFAARFAHLGFKVASETIALMQEIGEQGELDHLVPERVWKEMEKALTEATPVAFIQVLRQGGALKRLFPEIDVLYGVPQSTEHHPEKDTGIHVELVLTQASRLSPDPVIRFAALLHDLGKGLTPQAQWPKHTGHEEKGLQLVKELCNRLRVPTEYQELACLMATYHGACHSAPESTPEQLLALLEHCDAFRRQERFQKFLIACEADFRGRPGYENVEYVSGEVVRAAFAKAQGVNIPALVAMHQGQSGAAIKEAIHEARIKAIKEIQR